MGYRDVIVSALHRTVPLSTTHEEAAQVLIAALEQAGYCIVPMEPTPQMAVAGVTSMSASMSVNEPQVAVIYGKPGDVYRAMISARPRG